MPRLLLFTCHRWPNPALMAHALAAGGATVDVLGPWLQPSRLMRGPRHVASYTLRGKPAALQHAFAAWRPDLLIPCDDSAAAVLHRMRPTAPPALAACIERSLGGAAHQAEVLEKSRFIEFAAALGLRAPRQVILPDPAALPAALRETGLPCMVKRDESWGGAGVKRVTTPEEAQDVLRGFRAPPGWAATLRATLRQQDLDHLRQRLAFTPPGVALQALAPGRPVNRAVFCWQGKVLQGLTIEALHTLPDNGPASVVRELAHPGIAATSEALVRALGLSGFVGFDFMLDEVTGQEWLIEMNPRVTPAATLMASQPGFLARLEAALAGAPSPAPAAEPGTATHVLFPQEVQRDPASPWLNRAEHLVPWQEPELVGACLRHALRMRQQAEARQPRPATLSARAAKA